MTMWVDVVIKPVKAIDFIFIPIKITIIPIPRMPE